MTDKQINGQTDGQNFHLQTRSLPCEGSSKNGHPRFPYTIITLGLCRSVIILYEKKTRRVSRFADAHGSAISAYIWLNIKGGSRA